MSDLILSQADDQQTMTSLDLLEVINAARAECGENPLQNGHFLVRVRDELDLDEATYKKVVGQKLNSRGTYSYYLNLSEDQALLVGMRESKRVRRMVLSKLKEALLAPPAPAPDLTPRHSVLQMWQRLGGSVTLPKPLRVQMELLLRGNPAAVKKDSRTRDYFVATFIAPTALEQLSQHREDKLGRLKDGLETPDEVWQSFVEARDQMRAEYRQADGVAGLLH